MVKVANYKELMDYIKNCVTISYTNALSNPKFQDINYMEIHGHTTLEGIVDHVIDNVAQNCNLSKDSIKSKLLFELMGNLAIKYSKNKNIVKLLKD